MKAEECKMGLLCQWLTGCSKSVGLITFILVTIFSNHVSTQDDVVTFDQVLEAARNGSFLSVDATQQKEMAQLDYEIFKTRLKPSISLDGRVPGFFSSSSAITQPNGTIEFQRISQNNASLSLFAQQNIPLTGARLFVQSDLQRFDDFTLNNRLYNGIPLRIGISQPLFGFNQIKWDSKLAPVYLNEAETQYNFDLENTQFQATFLYFQVIIAEENSKIALLNTEVNENLIKIAERRLELGKISEDEKLQLQIELENARTNLRTSNYNLQAAKNNLATFLYSSSTFGNSNNSIDISNYTFIIPEPLQEIMIDEDRAVRMALKNRPEIIAYERQILESQRNMAQVKAQTGPQMSLFASFGLARGSKNLEQIYADPFTEQQLSLSFSIPIVDWGRRKSTRKQAEIQLQNTLANISQDKIEIENNTKLKVREFLMLQQAVQDQEAIRAMADKRFEIANERYILGAISITDFTLAQREKDQTRRNYIQTLSNYWNAYYSLRLLTGFDFAKNEQITY
ncbi:TolC family protein [Portibacter marinus]|uniref:TolC family protein n=1 Tax=Portibacter marinus TaxID=2898660 RepID=UPI001F1C9832|nr:TolC family protein [Portibacter marinus]